VNNKERVEKLQEVLDTSKVKHDLLVEDCGLKARRIKVENFTEYEQFDAATKEAFAPAEKFRSDLMLELHWAIEQGQKVKLPMTSCKSCFVELKFYRINEAHLVGAKVELGDLVSLIKPSRVQPDRPITKWYRQHGHKYQTMLDAVNEWASKEQKDDTPLNRTKLLTILKYDLRKNPLSRNKNDTQSE
jgi:hypothetical protein